MPRPRNTPLTQQEEDVRRALLTLRHNLGLTVARFANLIGINYYSLRNREEGWVGWEKDLWFPVKVATDQWIGKIHTERRKAKKALIKHR